MEAKHTPIEEWIEEAANNKFCDSDKLSPNKHITPKIKKWARIKKFHKEAQIELLTYLGLQGIENPKEWVRIMKGHKEITGFETPIELAAYEKGRAHEEKVIVKFIGDWQPNETNSVLGQLLSDKLTKLQAENKALQIYKMKYDAMLEIRASDALAGQATMEDAYGTILKLQAENIKLRNCGNCKHEESLFQEGNMCLGCCNSDEYYTNWEGK